MVPSRSSVEARKNVIGPGWTLPFTAPKQFSLPSTLPSTSSSEISGVAPMKLLG